MSAAWRARGKMVQLYDVRCGAEAEISFEMALRDQYRGENVGSSGSASSSRLAIRVVFPVPSPSGLPVWVQAGKGNDPIQKRRSLRMVPSSDEETESDDVGLCPHKEHRTVSMARLVGGIEGILGDQFSVPEQKEVVVVPSSPEASSPIIFSISPLVNLGSGSMSGGVPSLLGGSFQCEKPSLVDERGTFSHFLSFEAYAPAHARVDGAVARGSLQWMLEKGLVHVVDKVIESLEFANGVQVVLEACEALGFEKGKQLGSFSISVGESKS
ncbi:unnamed protein product [Lactuca saligna]|uniref:Uncharacterized protein n=1 Tax=Lactuca saligna TaxID=75948 RepID=A0AA36E2Q7_LACSI|nr:unnamed protein product [Lactuca saligna]